MPSKCFLLKGILADFVGVLLYMLVNFDGLTMLINWIRWCHLKYKKERNYTSDSIYHSKYRLPSFKLIRKTCEGLNCQLTSVICDEEGRGYVSNTKTQLDCKYLCADQFEPLTPPPPLNKRRKKTGTENVMNAYYTASLAWLEERRIHYIAEYQ